MDGRKKESGGQKRRVQEGGRKTAPAPRRRRWITPALAALAALGAVSVAFLAVRSVRAGIDNPATRRVSTGKPGPWGDLEYTRIAIEPPEDSINAGAAADSRPARWVFSRQTRAQVTELFRQAGLTDTQRTALMEKARWEESPGAVTVSPDRDLVLSLEPGARQTIYTVLARSKENLHQTQPFPFHPEYLSERLEASGLSDRVLGDFKRLLYPQGRFLVMADATAYASTLHDARERMRFIRTISRRGTLLMKLRVTAESDIDALDRYWNYDGNNRELRPLFESLARVPGGCLIDVTHLLPPFARKRLYSFPRADGGDPLAPKRDCHWTALNFFNDPPDDRFCDPQQVKQTLDTEYVKVDSGPGRLGDILVLFHPGGEALHSAVFVADDVVFTKNGGASTQPWIYMRLGDMQDYYAATCPPDNPPQMVTLRRENW